MKYMLDTNAGIVFIRGKNATLRGHVAAHPPDDLCVCSVVVGELRHGAKRSRNPVSEGAKVTAFLAPYASFSYDDAAAERYADVRTDLEARGLVIGSYDMLIAAIALTHNLTLVTHNTAEFNRVPGLQIVDWELP